MPTHRENSPAGEYPLLAQDTMKVAQKVGHQKKTNARFIAVRDGSRKKVRGLWQRGAKYYLQVKPPGDRTPRRIPLDALTLTDAKEEMERKKLEIRDGNAPARGRKPMFADYADAYVAILEKSQHGHKRPMTVAGERQGLEKWKAFLGRVRLDNITPGMIAAFRDQRLIEGRSPRTVNLNVQHLRNVLKKPPKTACCETIPRSGSNASRTNRRSARCSPRRNLKNSAPPR